MHLTFDRHSSAKLDRFSLTDSQDNSLYNYSMVFHLTLTVLLHYLAKIENHSCCRFEWHIACGTSEFNLLDMRSPLQLRSESYDCKSGKQCSSAQKRIRGVSELKKWMIDVGCGRQWLMKLIPVHQLPFRSSQPTASLDTTCAIHVLLIQLLVILI